MTPRPFGEWVARYERKGGDRLEFHQGEELFYDPLLGFFTWQVSGDKLLIPKMSGHLSHLAPCIRGMLVALAPLGVTQAYFCTTRNPKSWIRRLGGELVNQTQENGKTYSYITVTLETCKVTVQPQED